MNKFKTKIYRKLSTKYLFLSTVHSELSDDNWTAPQPIKIHSNQDTTSVAIDPSITEDGNTMHFLGISSKDYSNNS